MTNDEFLFIFWIILLVFSYLFKKYPILAIDAVFGIYLAYYFYDTSFMIALTLVFVNLYLLYDALDNWDHTK